jgi:hypothetical protein
MSFASLLLVTAACGDDNQVGTDAQAPDAAKTFKGYDADEGGELRVEYVRRADGTAFTRVTSFLWKDPGSADFTPYVNLNGCSDLRDKTKWPTFANPVGERVYMDSGDVTIKGGPMDLVLPKRTTMFMDPFGRVHPENTGNHLAPAMGTMPNDAAMYLPPATALDVSYAGSPDFPAQSFDDVIYMPADFNVTNFMPPVPVAISPATAAADMTFTFTNPAQTPAEPDGRVMSLVAFLSPTTGPIVACIEPADGSITMPKELVAIAKATSPNGTLARQTLSHVVRELKDKDGNTGRRIDFVGVWCYAYPYAFTP